MSFIDSWRRNERRRRSLRRQKLPVLPPGGGGGVCGTSHSEHAVSVQARAYVQLIGWWNTWEQAPGVPTLSPP